MCYTVENKDMDGKDGYRMNIMKAARRLVMLFLIIGICTGTFIAAKGFILYRNVLDTTSLSQRVESIRDKEQYTSIADMPETYLQAVLSVEDHRFYSHKGIDLIAIVRAIINDIKTHSFAQGGSTITQQLAKNLYLSQDKELSRKAAEIFLAFDLEKNYSKDEILEIYLNTIYFGNGFYCVKDASQGYFGKDPEDMTDYESTLLAGIPNAPSVYALTENPDLARQRQKQVIDRMVACGYFSQEEAETTQNQAVEVKTAG